MSALLPGYQAHPQDPTYQWNPATNDVRPLIQQAQQAPQTVAQADPSQYKYGALDMAAVEQDMNNPSFYGDRDKKVVWINFPKWSSKNPPAGEQQEINARLLPPLETGRAWTSVMRYRLDADLVPDAPQNRRVIYKDNLDSKGGPGGDPINSVLSRVAEEVPGAEGFVKRLRAKPAIYWSLLNLDSPGEHLVPLRDTAGNPVVDQNGQGMNKIVPGVMSMGMSLHSEILKYIREKGDPTHIDQGYNVKLIRRKTGPNDLDVEYACIDTEHGPLPEHLRPVLAHLVDLKAECVDYRPRAEYEAIAQRILQKFNLAQPGMPGAAGYPQQQPQYPQQAYPQPGYPQASSQMPAPAPMQPQYAQQPATYPATSAAPAFAGQPAAVMAQTVPPAQPMAQMPPAAQPATVAPPVQAAPPPPAQPAAQAVPAPPAGPAPMPPQAAPPVPPVPPAPPAAAAALPPGLPPPTAPGGVPAAVSTAASPGAPPPPPGMPQGVAPAPGTPQPVGTPPAPPASPAPDGGVSPGQFEQQLTLPAGDGQVPF